MATVLGIQLHDSMGSGGGAGEEIKYNGIFISCNLIDKPLNKFYRLWKIKVFFSK